MQGGGATDSLSDLACHIHLEDLYVFYIDLIGSQDVLTYRSNEAMKSFVHNV